MHGNSALSYAQRSIGYEIRSDSFVLAWFVFDTYERWRVWYRGMIINLVRAIWQR